MTARIRSALRRVDPVQRLPYPHRPLAPECASVVLGGFAVILVLSALARWARMLRPYLHHVDAPLDLASMAWGGCYLIGAAVALIAIGGLMGGHRFGSWLTVVFAAVTGVCWLVFGAAASAQTGLVVAADLTLVGSVAPVPGDV